MIARFVFVGLMIAMSWAAQAETETEHDRIVAERTAAAARFAEQQRACSERFVVSSCVDAARKEQRATLNRLRQQEQSLDDIKRRDAAAKRRQASGEKAEAQEQRASDAAPTTRRESVRHPPQPNPPARAASGIDAGLPPTGAGASAPSRREVEARNTEKFDARVRSTQAHREAVERRNAQRAAQGKGVAPLPVPAGASAAP